MFRLNFKIAIRNLFKNKLYGFINIIGLSIGLACFVMILLYTNHELSYDTWNPNYRQVYRVSFGRMTDPARGMQYRGIGPAQLSAFLSSKLPEVKAYTRFSVDEMYQRLVKVDANTGYYANNIQATDSSFFRVFPFTFIYGDPAGALDDPNAIVLNEEFSQKLFGQANPVGKVIKVNDKATLTVTGVVREPAIPSHFQFDGITRLPAETPEWNDEDSFYHLLLIDANANIPALEQKMSDAVQHSEYAKEEADNGAKYSIRLERVDSIYLHGDPTAQMGPMNTVQNVSTMFILGLLILVIACMNFTNLSIAKSTQRAKEVGLRKVLGSGRRALIRQFIGETCLQTTIALILGLILCELFLPLLNNTLQLHLSLFNNGQVGSLVLQLLSVIIAVSLASGIYPAFFLSNYQPVRVLKGNVSRGIKGRWLRKSLIVCQFCIAVVFIVSLLIISKQVHYLRTKDLGFQPAQVLKVNLISPRIYDAFPSLKQRLLKVPGVLSVSRVSFDPGCGSMIHSRTVNDGEKFEVDAVITDADYFETMGITLVEGRGFREGSLADTGSVVINESAARAHGLKEPLGKPFMYGTRIIGVVRDYHQKDVVSPIEATGFFMAAPSQHAENMVIRIQEANRTGIVKAIEAVWNDFEPVFPVQFVDVEQQFQRRLGRTVRMEQVFTAFTVVTIFVAMIGLFALAAFMAGQRTKEIAVRKILGASYSQLIRMLVKEFVILVLVANLFAWPLAFMYAGNWLQNFSYRIDMPVGPYLLAGLLSVVLAVVTVGYQAYRASSANPVDSLKYE